MNQKSILLFLFLSFCFLIETTAQRIEKEKDDSIIERDSSKKTMLQGIFSPPDTLKISVYHAQHPERLFPYPDTLLGNNFQQSDATRQQIVDYANLGSMGTPAKPILFEIKERKGLHLGFHQFDLYQRDLDEIRYFKVNRTFTEFFYGQNHTKQDFILKGVFSRNLNPEWNLSIDYDRISHLGIYSHQKSRHTAFTANLAYKHKKGKYKSYISYSFNDMQQEDNGGITSELNFNDAFYSDRSSIPIFLSAAETRTQEQIISYTQYFDFLSGKNDSLQTKQNKRHLNFGHQFVFSPGTYKFHDVRPAADSIFYGILQVDNQGLRQFLRWNTVENTFQVTTFKSNSKGTRAKDLLTIGLTHIYQGIQQEPIDTTINSLFLIGEWEYHPAKFLDLEAKAHYGIGNNSNEYLIKGKIGFNMGKIGKLSGEITNQRFSPDLIQQQLYISKRLVYKNNFVKPITTSIQASYHLPISKTTISTGYHLLNNHIYYDTISYAKQATSGISILQFVLQQNFRFGPFGNENTIALQTDNSDFIRLPLVSMKSSIYLEGNVFKRVMLARIGFDFRMNTSYFAETYQPVTGQFHLQDDSNIQLYPALDLFLSFKVQTFKAFAKMENMTGWFVKRPHYLTPGHPLADPHFRFGVSWRFLD